MDLALNYRQRLICHKIQPTNQPTNILISYRDRDRDRDLMEENGFKLAKERSRRYSAQTDYTDDIALLTNTPVQTKSRLLSLERAASSIGLHVNIVKTECMCFNQR